MMEEKSVRGSYGIKTCRFIDSGSIGFRYILLSALKYLSLGIPPILNKRTNQQNLAMREREPARHSIPGLILAKALDCLSSHGRPADSIPVRPRRQTAPSDDSEQSTQVHRRRSGGYQPPPTCPHLPPRTHCLTPSPIESEAWEVLPLDEQTQSPLLNLPKELRLLIYEEIVGKKIVHIVKRRNRLGHTLCKASGDYDGCKEEQCRGLKLPTGAYVLTGPGHGDLIPFLQSCRKVYVSQNFSTKALISMLNDAGT